MDRQNQPPPEPTTTALVPHPTVSRIVRLQQQQEYNLSTRYGIDDEDVLDSENGLVDYWRILVRHKTSIILSSLAGLIVGFAVGIPMKPEYRAHASVEVLNINQDFLNMRNSTPTNTNTEGSDASEEQTQAKLLRSSPIIERVFAKLSPIPPQVPQEAGIAASGWRHWLHLPNPTPLDQRQAFLSQAAASLKVTPSPHTRVLDITVDSKDPHLAADFANTLVEEFIQDNVESRRNSTQRTSEWLRQEIDDARTKLQKSEDALQAYASQSGLIFTDTNSSTNVETDKLKQVQQELSTATADRITKESRYQLSRNSPPDSLADILGDPGLRDANTKINDLRRQIASMSALYNPAYENLQQAQAELAALQSAFEKDRAAILARIQTDYQQAADNEKALAATYGKQTSEVTGQSQKGIQYNILKREVDSNRQLYDTMLQQTKQAAIALAMRASNVRIVEPAKAPRSPFFPNFPLNSSLGLFFGFMLSAAIAITRDRADRALQQPGDIKLWSKLTELGTIPNISKAGFASYYYSRGRNASLRQPATAAVLPQRAELMTLLNKPSAVAEAFRSVLTSILFTNENAGSISNVFVFTSPNPGDGKTTVVSNLAIATAEIRQRVVIIDADLRRPRMHNVFEIPNERGLSDFLTEEFSEENLASLIHETNVPGLHVIPGGRPTQAATHLLYSPNFAALISKLKEDYDMILIDTPPMLQMADARVAAKISDAVVVVARAGSTTRDSLLAIRDRFSEDRRRVLGTVLNCWDPARSRSGYYGQYSGAYKYAYEKYANVPDSRP